MGAQILQATPSSNNDQVSWQLCDQAGKCGAHGNFPQSNVAQGDPPTVFTITINDPNHVGAIFANNPHDPYAAQDGNGAIWIQQAPKTAPLHPVFDTAGQIPSVTRVTDTKIRFTDQNSEHGVLQLTYQLNFTVKGTPVTPLDPIIQNGGCCPTVGHPGFLPSTPMAFVVDLSIAFLIGAIVAFAIERWRR